MEKRGGGRKNRSKKGEGKAFGRRRRDPISGRKRTF